MNFVLHSRPSVRLWNLAFHRDPRVSMKTSTWPAYETTSAHHISLSLLQLGPKLFQTSLHLALVHIRRSTIVCFLNCRLSVNWRYAGMRWFPCFFKICAEQGRVSWRTFAGVRSPSVHMFSLGSWRASTWHCYAVLLTTRREKPWKKKRRSDI